VTDFHRLPLAGLPAHPSTHPLTGKEMRELRKHQRDSVQSPFVFVSERGAPLSAPGFSRMVERAGVEADLGIKVHAHMLRHATGFKLANDRHDTRAIQAYMGTPISRRPRATPRSHPVGSRASSTTDHGARSWTFEWEPRSNAVADSLDEGHRT
jgi:Phage integrase family